MQPYKVIKIPVAYPSESCYYIDNEKTGCLAYAESSEPEYKTGRLFFFYII